MSRFDEHRENGVPPSEVLAARMRSALGSPALHLEGAILHQTALELGGFAPFVPSPNRPFQSPLASPIFVGITCEKDSCARESHHFHPHQVEIYCVIKGALKMATWLGTQFKEFFLEPGDLLAVFPGSCHHLYEWVTPGLAYVFRSPNNITGDAAKIRCDGSYHIHLAEARAA